MSSKKLKKGHTKITLQSRIRFFSPRNVGSGSAKNRSVGTLVTVHSRVVAVFKTISKKSSKSYAQFKGQVRQTNDTIDVKILGQ